MNSDFDEKMYGHNDSNCGIFITHAIIAANGKVTPGELEVASSSLVGLFPELDVSSILSILPEASENVMFSLDDEITLIQAIPSPFSNEVRNMEFTHKWFDLWKESVEYFSSNFNLQQRALFFKHCCRIAAHEPPHRLVFFHPESRRDEFLKELFDAWRMPVDFFDKIEKGEL